MACAVPIRERTATRVPQTDWPRARAITQRNRGKDDNMPDYAAETHMPLDQAVLSEALSSANIPTLLMVLVQMTGDLSWLEPPYQPTRNRGLDDNDSGGLPDNLQAKVRAAALSAILDWQRGAPLAIPEPGEALLVRMLSVAMSE